MRNSFLAAGVAAAMAAATTPAVAQDSAYSGASEESAEAVAALGEAGVKTVAGVVVLPLAIAGAGSAAAGSAAEGLGDSAMTVGSETMDAAEASADFAVSPLTVTDDVVLKPQAAPNVPYQAQPVARPQ